MVNFIRAIKRPFTDIKKLIIGALLNLPIPVIKIFTNIMVLGYSINCGKNSSEGDYKLPEWKNYGQLWVDAFVALVIGLIYLIPALILSSILIPDFINNFINDGNALLASAIQNPMGIINTYGFNFIVAVFIFLFIEYLFPVVVLNWIINKKFSSAFDFEYIFDKVFNKKYFTTWFVISLIGVVLVVISFKFIPQGLLNDYDFVLRGFDLIKMLVLILIVSVIGFIKNVFDYTLYGNVLYELKKEKKTK